MTAARKTLGPKEGGSYLAKALDRWGASPPDWIAALANAADQPGRSQGQLAKLLGLTNASLISAVIGKKYQGRMETIEAKVRGALMSATVDCPALAAEIGRDRCAAYQARKFSASSPQMVKLHNTCPTCPNALGGRT